MGSNAGVRLCSNLITANSFSQSTSAKHVYLPSGLLLTLLQYHFNVPNFDASRHMHMQVTSTSLEHVSRVRVVCIHLSLDTCMSCDVAFQLCCSSTHGLMYEGRVGCLGYSRRLDAFVSPNALTKQSCHSARSLLRCRQIDRSWTLYAFF